TEIAAAKRGPAEPKRLKKKVNNRQITFLPAGFSLPGCPIDPLKKLVPHPLLEFALPPAAQHGAENKICFFGLADDVMSCEEVQNLPCRDSTVHVGTKSVRSVLFLGTS